VSCTTRRIKVISTNGINQLGLNWRHTVFLWNKNSMFKYLHQFNASKNWDGFVLVSVNKHIILPNGRWGSSVSIVTRLWPGCLGSFWVQLEVSNFNTFTRRCQCVCVSSESVFSRDKRYPNLPELFMFKRYHGQNNMLIKLMAYIVLISLIHCCQNMNWLSSSYLQMITEAYG
jgi:hypothetical protein